MLSIWSSFSDLPDPRTGNAQRHNLLDVLTIALTATICGAESCVEFADFARDREALFRDFLELPGGLPSHDTFSRLFRLLDPVAFAACLAQFLDGLGTDGPGVIAIDGKTMRRSFDRAAKRSALHVVTAFATGTRMVIGQVTTGDKESEIIAARTLLGLLDLNGTLVTGDALHCQGGTAALIQERGGDWLFTLNANRPAQHKEVAAWFADPHTWPEPEHTTTDADHGGPPRPPTTAAHHGRIEVRRHVVSHDVDWMLSDRRHPDEARLPGLGMIGMVEATVTRDGKTSTERRFYLSSARMDAGRFATTVRAHWRIENSLHWAELVKVPRAQHVECQRRGSTSSSTRTAPETGAIMDPRTSPPCANSPSTSSAPHDQVSQSDASVSVQDGPTSSHDPSSVKCDSPACCPLDDCLYALQAFVPHHRRSAPISQPCTALCSATGSADCRRSRETSQIGASSRATLLADAPVQTMVVVSSPMFSTHAVTTSPGFRNCPRGTPTPAGVPVMMRSPGHRVSFPDRCETCSARE